MPRVQQWPRNGAKISARSFDEPGGVIRLARARRPTHPITASLPHGRAPSRGVETPIGRHDRHLDPLPATLELADGSCEENRPSLASDSINHDDRPAEGLREIGTAVRDPDALAEYIGADHPRQ